MIITKCKHHPKYDPASGEPTVDPKWAPSVACGSCWRARAKWLDDGIRLGAIERIAELEGQLADLQEQKKSWQIHEAQNASIIIKVKKREVVLRKALEQSHEVVIYVQNNTQHLEGCPNVPMTCMRCVVDDLRKSNRAALLAKFGGHTAECVWHEGQYEVEGGGFPETDRRCDCGAEDRDRETIKEERIKE